MLMAELGARVIKVEPPGVGDDSRQYAPFINGRPCYFGSVNRGKESIALDLKSPSDREIFEALLEKADVVAENFRPGVMEKLGYGWETLHERYPRLIYVATSGFGHTGPANKQPAYDLVVQGMSGLMSVTGEPEGPACKAGFSVADVGAGLYTAVAVNSALLHRERTGISTKVDVAMFDCLVGMLESVVSRYVMTGHIGGRLGATHPAIAPFAAFPTSDGSMTIACGNDGLFQKLCEALGLAEFAQDPRFSTNSLRVQNREALHAVLEAELTRSTTSHWCELFGRAGVPAGPINNIAEALAHPQIAARNMLVEALDPVLGPVKLVGNPIKMSAFEDKATRRVAPDLDQDRNSILEELGFASASPERT